MIANVLNPFSRYYSEILSAEGLNEYTVADIANVSASTLSNYDVVILGEMALNSGQVTMLTNWVNGGGHLIAMRPDQQLASLLGLSPTNNTLSNAYLQVQTSSGPGVGIVGQTIQFHGPADLYTLSGASQHRNPLFECEHIVGFPRGDHCQRGCRTGRGLHLRFGTLHRLHTSGQSSLVGTRSRRADSADPFR